MRYSQAQRNALVAYKRAVTEGFIIRQKLAVGAVDEGLLEVALEKTWLRASRLLTNCERLNCSAGAVRIARAVEKCFGVGGAEEVSEV